MPKWVRLQVTNLFAYCNSELQCDECGEVVVIIISSPSFLEISTRKLCHQDIHRVFRLPRFQIPSPKTSVTAFATCSGASCFVSGDFILLRSVLTSLQSQFAVHTFCTENLQTKQRGRNPSKLKIGLANSLCEIPSESKA